jgi:hypothetical protein
VEPEGPAVFRGKNQAEAIPPPLPSATIGALCGSRALSGTTTGMNPTTAFGIRDLRACCSLRGPRFSGMGFRSFEGESRFDPSHGHHEPFRLREPFLIGVEGQEFCHSQLQRGGNMQDVSQTMSRCNRVGTTQGFSPLMHT